MDGQTWRDYGEAVVFYDGDVVLGGAWIEHAAGADTLTTQSASASGYPHLSDDRSRVANHRGGDPRGVASE